MATCYGFEHGSMESIPTAEEERSKRTSMGNNRQHAFNCILIGNRHAVGICY